MKVIICIDQAEFDTLNQHIQDSLTQNVQGYNAEKWAEPIIHPVDGSIAIIIEDRVLKYLTPEQIARIDNNYEVPDNAED